MPELIGLLTKPQKITSGSKLSLGINFPTDIANELVRSVAASALAQFGTDAKAAVPDLIDLARNTRPHRMFDSPIVALRQIDPEAAARVAAENEKAKKIPTVP